MRTLLLPVAACLALVLCGCPARKPAAAKASPQATAPTLHGQQPAAETKAAAAAPAADQPSRESQGNPEQDKALIAAAKQAYDSGVALYGAAQYQKARAEFDRAVDIFLTSGRDLKSDPALNDAFNSTVDAINTLEMDSLQQSNGFSQQEQTPVEVANDVTFPVDPNLLARAQADLKFTRSDLPLVVNDYVASYINYFTNTRKGHNTIANSLARAGRYKGMVEEILAKNGLPKDLIYLAVAESGFRPRSVNRRSRAGGMWQFMPHGDYGLVRNSWVDERFDPAKSTEAYARYIKELHDQFGDWYLAMAAYDWGPGKIQRAVQRTGYADFWQLYQRNVLPAETKNYVPIILAAAIMAKNPSQYGLTDIATEPAMVSDTVTTHSAVNLNLVADLTGTTVDEIEQMNPALLRMSTPGDMAYELHIPAGTAAVFTQRIALIPEEHRNSWRFHVAAEGDTLGSIAQTYHVKTAELEAANQLEAGDPIQEGQALAIPVKPAPVAQNRRYRVRRGDTIVTLADRFGVTTTQLRRWNGIRGNRVPAGRLIYVSEPVRTRRSRRAHAAAGASYRTSAKAKSKSRRKSRSRGNKDVTVAASGSHTSKKRHPKKKSS